MRFFKSGKVYDFMSVRYYFIALSLVLILGGLGLLLFGKGRFAPVMGTDFRGGTEVEVAFKGAVDTGQVRKALQQSGFGTSDVIKVEDTKQANHYLIRVQEVSTLSPETKAALERALCLNPSAE